MAGPVVALGDSYTAGAMLPIDPQADAARLPAVGQRAYPVLVAAALHATLTDVACASAGVKNMTAAQPTYLGTNPAQLAALGAGRRRGAAHAQRRRHGLPERAQASA